MYENYYFSFTLYLVHYYTDVGNQVSLSGYERFINYLFIVFFYDCS